MDLFFIICSVNLILFTPDVALCISFQPYYYADGSDFFAYINYGVMGDESVQSTESEADDYENIDCHPISSQGVFDQFQPYTFYDIDSVLNLSELPYQDTCTTFDALKYYRDLSFPEEHVLLTVWCTDTEQHGFFEFDFTLEGFSLFTTDSTTYNVPEGNNFELMQLTKEQLDDLSQKLIQSALPIVSNSVQTKSKYSCQSLTMRDSEIYTKIESSYRYYLSWVVCNESLSLEMESNAYLDSCGTPFLFGFSGLSPDRTVVTNTEKTEENKNRAAWKGSPMGTNKSSGYSKPKILTDSGSNGAAWNGSPKGTNKSGGHSKPKTLTDSGSNGKLFPRYKTKLATKDGMIIHRIIDQESRLMASLTLSLYSLLFTQIYLKLI